MKQIEKNTVAAENQLAGAGLVTFENRNGKGRRVLFVGNSITRPLPLSVGRAIAERLWNAV